jgi:hypothetical protein
MSPGARALGEAPSGLVEALDGRRGGGAALPHAAVVVREDSVLCRGLLEPGRTDGPEQSEKTSGGGEGSRHAALPKVQNVNSPRVPVVEK